RGFIGIAAQALGGQTPIGTLLASLFFGMTDALSNFMHFIGIPSEFVQMLPYLATVVALALYARRQVTRRARLARVNRPVEAGTGAAAEGD
ncbi:MAG TPA: hypothetical protein DHW14_02235, partial [Clostridiales bacterium]|nr:hypothetical protein [Clostridiales bacterium]